VPIKRRFWANAGDIVGIALPCRAMDDIEAVFITGTEIERERHEIAENLQRIDGAGAGNANRAIPKGKGPAVDQRNWGGARGRSPHPSRSRRYRRIRASRPGPITTGAALGFSDWSIQDLRLCGPSLHGIRR
jgi:hypothetical protein